MHGKPVSTKVNQLVDSTINMKATTHWLSQNGHMLQQGLRDETAIWQSSRFFDYQCTGQQYRHTHAHMHTHTGSSFA